MKTKKSLWLLSIVLGGLLLFCARQDWAQPRLEKGGPIIAHAFAVEKGKYGYIWRIYIEADDPGGKMMRIASVVNETGVGWLPTDWVYLKPRYQKHLKGYLQWNTFSSKAPDLREWTQITLRISVLDKAGNESNEVVFPFTFESGVKNQYSYKLPAPFDQENLPRLGYLHIDLMSPTGRRGRG